eukprot:TRINITY_DN19560_c0_g1_i1.p1 TRINITY_DN19560_c0_g1~~TRINITY_DN19560_c0_g1_i1.p1  ORF type:complete len:220 (-),score=55.65 TRINITY_DN19560_c0_g1_i1:205-864(-)
MGIISEVSNKMKGFAAVIALAAVIAGVSAQYQASQAYLIGHHNGLNLGANTQLIATYINDGYLSPQNLIFYFSQAASSDPNTKLIGLQNLYGIFYNFSALAYNIITRDQNFTTAMNYTLTLLASPQGFQYRADLFRRRTGYDVYAYIAQAANLGRAGDFYNSGVNFGWVVLNLRNVASEEDISTIVAPPALSNKVVEIVEKAEAEQTEAKQSEEGFLAN